MMKYEKLNGTKNNYLNSKEHKQLTLETPNQFTSNCLSAVGSFKCI